MNFPHDLVSDPFWVPHSISDTGREIQFLRLKESDFASHEFLANVQGRENVLVSLEQLMGIEPVSQPTHFVFHSGFCRSTLLLRAFMASQMILGINEPEILNCLVRSRSMNPKLTEVILRLLGRAHRDGQAVVIKPSNFANRLIPEMLAACPESRAVVITNSLDEYLHAVVRKGLPGRKWARQVYLSNSMYAGKVDAFRDHLPGMSDLEVAALGWLLNQNWIRQLVEKTPGGRIKVLHSEFLNDRRQEAMSAAIRHYGLKFDEKALDDSARAFAFDAKTGRPYDEKQKEDEERSGGIVIAEEIAEVSHWIDQMAHVSNLEVPVAQTLV